MSCLRGLSTDIVGLSETNACWSHPHLRSDFHSATRRFYKQSKVSFGSPTSQIDPCSQSDTFQAGGNLTLITGFMTSRVTGQSIEDPTGLGRWSGVTLEGKDGCLLTIITAYRVCHGSPSTAPLGSSFLREYEFFRRLKSSSLNPRRHFLSDLKIVITNLQESGHSIILMLDANSTMVDRHFSDFVHACGLHDAHSHDPAPSTYIGSATRRIDFILCCDKVKPHIVRSGTLAYNEGPQSDHRGLYIDVSSDLLIRPKWSAITPTSQRDLHTGNPELVLRYQASMLSYYSTHQMVERIQDLFQRHHEMTRAEVRTLLIKWDNDQGRAMKHSERILSRPPKKCSWSPDLRNSAIVRRYWYLRLREITKQENFQSTFLRWQRQLQSHDSSFIFPFLGQELSIETVREHFNRSNRAFRKNQRRSIPLRLQTYHDLLATYEDDMDISTQAESRRKARIIKNTLDGESTRHTFSNIRRTLKPAEQSSLSKLKIPTNTESIYQSLQDQSPDDFTWETVVERKDIERHISSYNRDSFRAAAESPCGHGIVHDALTYTSLSQAASDLLQQEIPPEWYGDDVQLKEFLTSFAIPPHVTACEPIATTLTPADVLKGFKSWKETTSTSPSGRHLGHYKSLVQHPVLLDCFVKFMNIVITRGIAVPRWCNATSVMLEKDAGNPRIHRLRIIHLFEADFNFFLKIQWGHRLVRRAVDLDLLHDSQHGSTPGKTTMDPIMLNQLTTDLCRILKHDLARFDNDASACYDRIIVALGMLAARRCGMPTNAIRLHSEALKFMQYTVKTFYGVSETNYAGTEFEPLFGTGQGSGASPAVWLSLVVILLHTLDRIIPDRMNFVPISSGRSPHSRLSDAFVDDTSVGFTSSSDTETLDSLVSRLQRVAQTWEHLLHLSGGKLNLSKCSWYVLRWEWQSGRPILSRIRPSDPQLSLLQGSQDTPVEIRRTPVAASSKMLGVLLNPLGDFTDHLQLLKQKADTFARRILSPRITSSDACIFHRSMYIPSMRYSLAALAVDEEALGGVQTRVIESMLQKMGFSSKIPTSIRHGPVEMGGLGIYDLRTEAGLEALKFFRNSIYAQTETGNLLRLNLEYSQRESGLGTALLRHPGVHIPYLTPSWILSLRQYLFTHNMTVEVTDSHVDLLRGSTDRYIMDLEHLKRYSPSQQRDINLVRMHLQVTTLSELVDASQPNRIDLSFLDARRKPCFIPSLKWPRQPDLTATQRRLWKRYISSSYLRYIPYWRTPSPPFEIPLDLNLPTTPTFASLKSLVRALPRTQRRLLDGLEQVATDTQVEKAFRSRSKLHVASDGGLSEGIATHGWVLSTKKRILFRCSGPVDGPVDTNSSTRSELGGCASVLLLLVSVSRLWGGLRHRCAFRWYTDSRSAITRIKKYALRKSRSRQMPHDADLMSIIKAMLKELRRPFSLQWVKAHQDDIASYDSLPLAARLNIDADFLATRYRSRGRLRPSESVDHQESQHCSFYINGIPVVSQFDACVRFHVNGYHYRRYVQAKTKWSDATWKSVDFHNLGHHLKRLSPSHRNQHIKFIHDYLPLGQRRYREAKIPSAELKLCPCCRNTEETTMHLLKCSENPEFLSSLATLKSDILTKDVHPVRYLIYEGLYHWTFNPGALFAPVLSHYPPHFHTLLSQALQEQRAIGWDQALKGYFSKTWSLLAQRGMSDPSCDSHTGEKRMRNILRSLHDHTRRLWLSRNTVLYSDADVTLADIRSQEVAEIKFYHSRPELLLSLDQHLCHRSLSRLLSGSSSTRRRWLRMVKRSSADMTKDGTRQSRITSFFAPIPASRPGT